MWSSDDDELTNRHSHQNLAGAGYAPLSFETS